MTSPDSATSDTTSTSTDTTSTSTDTAPRASTTPAARDTRLTHATRTLNAAWYLAAALYAAFTGAWLLIGLATALTAHVASLHTWAATAAGGGHGSTWTSIGKGLLSGAAESYPVTGIVLDYVFSGLNILIAVLLATAARRDWTVRLLAIGLVGSAGAFNLQAHTAIAAVAACTGLQISWWHVVLLHGVGGAAFTFALLLFPSGSGILRWSGPPRRRAMRTLITIAAAGCAGLISASTAEYPHSVSYVLFFGLLIPITCGAAQYNRYLRADGVEARQQSRNLLGALGAAFAAAVALTAFTLVTRAMQTPGLADQVSGMSGSMPGMGAELPGLSALGEQPIAFWIFRVLFTAVPATVAVSLLRYRLSAVEPVFNRTLIYGALIVVIGCVYVFGAVRVDALFGLDSDWLAPPQVAAAGLVAVAFHPLRIRLERWADRLVYGKRVPPYEVLARVSALSQAGGPGAQALVSLAQITAQGLGTGAATVYLNLHDGTQETYRWPPAPVAAPAPAPAPALAPTAASTPSPTVTPAPEPTTPTPTSTEPATPSDHEDLVSVVYQGTVVGALGLPAGPGRKPAAQRRALITDLARGAGVILHNAGLSIDLDHRLRDSERRAAEIRRSRWRIVAAQDSERRELERDLHDGAQPGLTAVRLSLGLVTHLAASGKQKAAREALARLHEQVEGAAAGLRQVLRGLDPPALNRDGVTAALRELAESLGAEIEFRVGERTRSARFAPDIEAAVFFCCAEALQNAAKHCPDASITLTLERDDEAVLLHFTVADNGPGFDPAAASDGSGLQNMADRIAAVGGVLTIDSAPDLGTTVSGAVPAIPSAEPR